MSTPGNFYWRAAFNNSFCFHLAIDSGVSVKNSSTRKSTMISFTNLRVGPFGNYSQKDDVLYVFNSTCYVLVSFVSASLRKLFAKRRPTTAFSFSISITNFVSRCSSLRPRKTTNNGGDYLGCLYGLRRAGSAERARFVLLTSYVRRSAKFRLVDSRNLLGSCFGCVLNTVS